MDSCRVTAVLFFPAISQPSGLVLLTNLYIGRSFHIWKLPELMPWLERNAHVVLKKVDSQDPIIRAAEEKRKTRYQGAPRNIYRHVLMSDIKDATTSLPKVRKKKRDLMRRL